MNRTMTLKGPLGQTERRALSPDSVKAVVGFRQGHAVILTSLSKGRTLGTKHLSREM